MRGRATVRSYRDLMVALRDGGRPSITHAQACAGGDPASGYLCIRHDVDHDLATALEMARIECHEGIRATYFLLPPGDYDKTDNYYGRIEGDLVERHAALAEGARQLVALGHEVGLHNDFLQLGFRLRRPFAALIEEEIAFFASIGVPVVGTASHGSRFAGRHGFTNYEVFSETFGPRRQRRNVDLAPGWSVPLFEQSMHELGLRYEAYFLPRDMYLSDTGSRFVVGRIGLEQVSLGLMQRLVGDARQIVALFHPDWWTSTCAIGGRMQVGAPGLNDAGLPDADGADAAGDPVAAPAPEPVLVPVPVPVPATVLREPELDTELDREAEPDQSGIMAPDVAPSSESGEPSPPPADPTSVVSPPPAAIAVARPIDPSAPTFADYAGFLAMLQARGDVEFITYDDLLWGDDDDHVNSFPGEWARWRARLQQGGLARDKAYVLLQHDTDSGPSETIAIAQLEAAYGARSSIMTFARKPTRVGEPEVDAYDIDWTALRALQHRGFAIGYHCNALHVANFEADAAARIFEDDVATLRRHGLRIDYFSPHGGKASAQGLTNASIDYPLLTATAVRWVSTRFSARFDGYFSDGGSGTAMSGVQRQKALRDFVAQMRPGCRYRVLVHAQYYRAFDDEAAPCLLPPWPVRVPSAHDLFGRGLAARATSKLPAVRVANGRSPRQRAVDLARRVARRLLGTSSFYRALLETRAARLRLQDLEAANSLRAAEIERLRRQLGDMQAGTRGRAPENPGDRSD